jgi:hypothetical protein
MERILLTVYFLMTGCLPLALGAYTAYEEHYAISVTCFIIALCGFQEIHYVIKCREEMVKCKKQMLYQSKELATVNKIAKRKDREIWDYRNYG